MLALFSLNLEGEMVDGKGVGSHSSEMYEMGMANKRMNSNPKCNVRNEIGLDVLLMVVSFEFVGEGFGKVLGPLRRMFVKTFNKT